MQLQLVSSITSISYILHSILYLDLSLYLICYLVILSVILYIHTYVHIMPPRSSLTSSFSVTDANNEVVCPLKNNDGSNCRKRCLGVSILFYNVQGPY